MPARTQPRTGKLELDPTTVAKARGLAEKAGQPIVDMTRRHTTVAVERATLRLAGLSGADADGTPWVNRLMDCVRGDVGLEHGVALPVWDALLRGEADDLTALAQKASAGLGPFPPPRGPGRRRGDPRLPGPGRDRRPAHRRTPPGARAADRRGR